MGRTKTQLTLQGSPIALESLNTFRFATVALGQLAVTPFDPDRPDRPFEIELVPAREAYVVCLQRTLGGEQAAASLPVRWGRTNDLGWILERERSELADPVPKPRFMPGQSLFGEPVGADLAVPRASVALAQPMREVVVVPLGASDVSAATDATSSIEATLANMHVPVISLHDARDRFTARSRPPQQLTESDLEALIQAAHDAMEHVAFGRTASAQKSVREVIARAERALESLNRETATARQILDACLSLVRSSLQTGTRQHALEQAMRCRQLVPDLVPDRTSQPANVIGVLAEADDLLARMRIGHLTVQSTPEPRCAVYLNGRHLGTTPFELDRAAAGVYRVQAECGATPARVHMVQLGDAPVSLLVDTELDRAVATDPRLVLRYDEPRKARAHAVSGAVSLGREMGAEDVVLVAVEAGRAELSRVHVRQGRLVGRSTLPWSERRGFDAGALERAIAALAEARIEGTPSLQPRSRPAANDSFGPSSNEGSRTVPNEAQGSAGRRPPPANAPADHGGRSTRQSSGTHLDDAPDTPAPLPSVPGEPRTARRWKVAFGTAALVVGAGLFTATGVFATKRHDAGQRLRDLYANSGDVYSARVKDWDDTRLSPYIFAALGSAALTASALGLLLSSPREAFPRWASIVSGLAGAGLAVWGITDIARGGACSPSDLDRRFCSDDLERRDRGALVLLAAAPLLAVSLTQLLRGASAPNPTRALIYPDLDPFQKSISLRARVGWF